MGGEPISHTSAVVERTPTPGFLPQNRKYLGSKYRLLDFITETIVSRVGSVEVFADLFAGTGVVANAFRDRCTKVIANDLLYSNYAVNRAFLASTKATVSVEKTAELIERLNRCAPVCGYAHANYSGTYFTGENAARIDGIRDAIETFYAEGRCSEQERLVLLTSLLFAADKVANTVGQYDAFLKHIDAPVCAADSGRHLIDSNVYKPLILKLPAIELSGNRDNEVFNEDANDLAARLQADVLYLDPPYNTRQYVDCYHVLENICLWNKPLLKGKTRKFERDHLKSRYSRKNEAARALRELVQAARGEHIFLSYNNEGIIAEADIREILGSRGKVEVVSREYAVFGNGAGSARRRTLQERIFYCRRTASLAHSVGSRSATPASRERPEDPTERRRQTELFAPPPGSSPADPAAERRPGANGKIEMFDARGNSRGFYSPRNRLNDLTGREWVYWSKSVINKPYPPNLQHKLRSSHGGQKPPDLCGDLIEVFTKAGQRVLDPFAGVGGTLLGAALRGREAVGVEVNSQWIEIYREVCRLENVPEQRMIRGDSRIVLGQLAGQGRRFDLLLTDVPYWRMDRNEQSKGQYKRVGQRQKQARRSKLKAFNRSAEQSKEQWLEQMREVFACSLPLLRDKGYVVVFIGDMYHGGRYHMLSSDLASLLCDLGLIPKANLIWYDVSKSLHIYGYQYEYIPSMIHQNILVFRKQA